METQGTKSDEAIVVQAVTKRGDRVSGEIPSQMVEHFMGLVRHVAGASEIERPEASVHNNGVTVAVTADGHGLVFWGLPLGSAAALVEVTSYLSKLVVRTPLRQDPLA